MLINFKKYKELAPDNLASQLIKYGWFPEEVPLCFNAHKINKSSNDLFLLLNPQKPINSTTYASTLLSTYKDDLLRRILSFSNLEVYLHLIKIEHHLQRLGYTVIN